MAVQDFLRQCQRTLEPGRNKHINGIKAHPYLVKAQGVFIGRAWEQGYSNTIPVLDNLEVLLHLSIVDVLVIVKLAHGHLCGLRDTLSRE